MGIVFLLVGFVINFWVTPKKVVSQNEIAIANLKWMEASVVGGSSKKSSAKPATEHISKALKATRKKQMRYMTIIAMLFGTLFVGYSFINKERED